MRGGWGALSRLRLRGNRPKSLTGADTTSTLWSEMGRKRTLRVHRHIPHEFAVSLFRENVMDTFRTMAVAGMRFAFLRGAKEHVRDPIARVVILIL